MKKIIRMESFVLLVVSLYLYFFIFKYSWIIFLILLLFPDLSMFGYIFNNKLGAYTYNSIHNILLPSILFIIGVYFNNHILVMLGLILFAHIFMDRSLGYGLKYTDEFKHTHI